MIDEAILAIPLYHPKNLSLHCHSTNQASVPSAQRRADRRQ